MTEGRPPRVIWVMNHPTPQMTPIINSIADALPGLEMKFHDLGARGRGWGHVPVTNRCVVVGHHGPVRQLGHAVRDFVRVRPHAVVCFGYAGGYNIGLLLCARLTRRPVAIRSDSAWSNERQKPRWLRIIKRCVIRALLSSRRSIAWTVGDDNREYWRRYGRLRGDPIPFESPIPDDGAVHASANTTRRTVLFIGRLVPIKGIDLLLELDTELRRRHVGHSMRVVGSGPLEQRIAARGCIELVGSVPHLELSRELSNANVLVVPSQFEPYGLVVREALQFGLPVVATDAVIAARELCDEGWNIVGHNAVEMADAVEMALGGGRWARRPPIDLVAPYSRALSQLIIGENGPADNE